jgi:hypothetical protein
MFNNAKLDIVSTLRCEDKPALCLRSIQKPRLGRRMLKVEAFLNRNKGCSDLCSEARR